MEGHRRAADGWRIVSTTFELGQIGRGERIEATLAELSRELPVWRRWSVGGST